LNRACHFALPSRRDSTIAPSSNVTEEGESLGIIVGGDFFSTSNDTNKNGTVQRLCNGFYDGSRQTRVMQVVDFIGDFGSGGRI
jgi:hypothetical protein